MKLEEKNIIVKRPYKSVYKCDDSIVKVFEKTHPKSDVFNEALITARIEETGLDIPKVKGVTQVEGKWAIEIEFKDGKTLEEMMNSDKKNIGTRANTFRYSSFTGAKIKTGTMKYRYENSPDYHTLKKNFTVNGTLFAGISKYKSRKIP